MKIGSNPICVTKNKIMKRELDRVVVLIISIVTFIMLLPINLVIAVLRIAKSILTIIEKTLLFIVDTTREELLKF